MKHVAALTFVWVVLITLVFISGYQHQGQQLLIDAQSPGVWPTYAAADEATIQDPDTVCMHVLIPKAMRREVRPREVTKT